MNIGLLFLFSLVIAWTNESITFGVAATLFFYAIFQFKKLKLGTVAMISGFGMGVFLTIFSPGTLSRAAKDISFNPQILDVLKEKIINLIGVLYLLKIQLLLGLILLTILFLLRKTQIKAFFKLYFIEIGAIFFNVILLVLVGNTENRMLFGISIFTLILNIYLLRTILVLFSKNTKYVFSGMAVMTLFFGFQLSLREVKNYHNQYKLFEDQFSSQPNSIYYFPTTIESRYIYHTLGGIKDKQNYHNRVRGFYYQVPNVNILPQNVYDLFFPINTIITNQNLQSNWNYPIYWKKGLDYLIIELPKDYQYDDKLSANIIFINNKKTLQDKQLIEPQNQKIIKQKVSLIPIEKNYYAFIKLKEMNSFNIENIELESKKNLIKLFKTKL